MSKSLGDHHNPKSIATPTPQSPKDKKRKSKNYILYLFFALSIIINNDIKKMIIKDTIVLLNKSDVLDKQNHKLDADTVLASVKDNTNIDKLINKIKEKLSKKFTSNNTALITRERHRVKLNECLKEIDNFLKKDQNKDLELAAEDLRMATRHLGSIIGKVDVEEILGSIFKDFCIGK